LFRNTLITALRSFARHKLYSVINIAGLTVGLACAIFIILFLRDELSYDTWVPDSENLYRVESTFYLPGRDPDFFPFTPFPVTPTMQAEIPEVVAHTHLTPEQMTAQVGDRQFPVTVNGVDPNFFQVIKLPLVQGDPTTVLKQPESLVLTEATAKKFFGTANPIGKTVLLGGSHSLVVTGIMRDLPHNTHLSIDLVMPNTSKAEIAYPLGGPGRTAWLNIQGWGYVKLAPHADLARIAEKLKPMLDRHVDAKKQMNLNISGRDVLHPHLTPFRTVHLAPFGDTEKGRWETVYGFAAIAALIILIASINYMNLATARALTRAREVSLRKVLGARRSQLIAQFMGESVIMALIALALAFAAVEVLLPQFDHLLGRPVAFHLLGDWPLTLAIMAIALLVGLLGGVYPAFVLSSFRPAANLGANASRAGGSGLLRTGLVVLQFAISIGLGIAAIVIFAQINYSRQMDLGFDRHNLLVIKGSGTLMPSARDSLAQALAAEPSIAGVAQSNMVPFDGNINVWAITPAGSAQSYTVRNLNIDPNFLDVYGMKLLAGRRLSRDRGTDNAVNPDLNRPNPSFNILINEAAARQFGYTPADAVGHAATVNFATLKARLTIVGVVSDANFDGLQSAMQPFNFFYGPINMGPVSVRIRPGQTQAALSAVDRIWHRFVPTVAIQRSFEDASFDHFFVDDERQGRIFGIFVGIAIFIAALGLFGLASFTAERRTKEIGIRKVHGARTRDIVRLLLWQFSIPVLIANLIAWPVAYFYLRDWLQGFAYRISLNPLYFVVAGAAALVIAWATVIVHAAHVARANPIHALRYE
jgi:putative ABC transport system permease protein